MSRVASRDNEAKVSTIRVSKVARLLLFVAVASVVVITVVRTAIWWKSNAGISFASGVMITMAADLNRGVFYRPLFGAAGYGGTRYFPLYFCLHALLLKLGLPVLISAYLLSAVVVALLLLGIYRLLRALGIETWLATCASFMMLAASSVQMSLTTPQADGLAAALNIWGLGMIVPTPRSGRRILMAALLFTLAWSAKLTTVFGLAAAVVWLLITGYRRVAGLLAAETLCGYAIVGGAMLAASRGRVIEIFRACAAGGTDWKFFAGAPLRMARMAYYTDSALFGFGVLALAALISWRMVRSLPGLLLIATLAITIVIFGSPGTTQNHLLDLQVAAVLVLPTLVQQASTHHRKQLAVYTLALLTVAGAVLLQRHIGTWSRWYHPHQFRQVIAAIPNSHQLILAENPIIPVLAGQQPYVIDPWMVQLLRTRIPGFQEPLLERLRNQDFAAVVLTTGDISEKGARSGSTTTLSGRDSLKRSTITTNPRAKLIETGFTCREPSRASMTMLSSE